MNQNVALYYPVEDDREERRDLNRLRQRTMERARLQRVRAVEAENNDLKERAMRAGRARRNQEAKMRQRSLGYWIGAIVGMLMVLGWMFTKDFGITALPALLGAILMGRLK